MAENERANVALAEETLKGLLLPYYPAASLAQRDLPENMVDRHWIIGHASFPEGRYSAAMLHGLSLVSHLLNSNDNVRRVLCLGVSDVLITYALGSFLGFSVVGIDNDIGIVEALANFEFDSSNSVSVGFHHYDDFLHELRTPGVKQGDEWDKMREKDWGDSGFDAIFIDVNQPAPPSRSGICLCSPPRNFLTEDTLMAANHVLRAHGVIVLHVVAPDYFFYVDTVKSLQQFVGKVYETRLNESEYVLVATGPDVDANTANDAMDDNSLLIKLKEFGTTVQVQ
ncbi:hypothetical protein CTI12_AA573720 [Artemisia annua]|uniref:S-adenosyl-L-methionine-dependent methyltransferases superfamily protein n=1 Tax=Artemisia annua TaxID=35608 RepID=A0A2U1KR46_ARTAN|nr:hypothetical protein CTI12_AA573720 [Artemisia annua]